MHERTHSDLAWYQESLESYDDVRFWGNKSSALLRKIETTSFCSKMLD
jgi:hypothetical protein